MDRKDERDKKGDNLQLFGTFISRFPSLAFKFFSLFLRFKKDAKKGSRIFQEELINQGIDKTTATALTDAYLESSDIMSYIHF